MFKHIKNDKIETASSINYFYLGSFTLFFVLITFGNFSSFEHTRWNAGLDINQDGLYSISDITGWVLWIFFMPGDVLVQGLAAFPGTASFFEVSENSYGNIGSFLFSTLYWWLTGAKKLVFFWFAIILLIMLRNLPEIPFLYG